MRKPLRSIRHYRPGLDSLEGRALLSFGGAGSFGPHPLAWSTSAPGSASMTGESARDTEDGVVVPRFGATGPMQTSQSPLSSNTNPTNEPNSGGVPGGFGAPRPMSPFAPGPGFGHGGAGGGGMGHDAGVMMVEVVMMRGSTAPSSPPTPNDGHMSSMAAPPSSTGGPATPSATPQASMAGTDGDGGEPQPLKNSAAPSVSDLSSMARSGDPGAMPDTTRSAPPVGASFTTATPPAGTGLPQLVGRGTADHSPAPLGAQSHVSVILGPLGLNSTVATADVRSVAAHTVNAALATADNLSVLIPGGSFAASIAMAARSVGIDLGPWGRKDNDAPAHPVNQGASAQSTATVATNANGESSDALSMASTPIEGEGESLADGSTRLPSSEEDVIASLPVDPEGLYYLSIAHGIHGLKDPTKPVMEEATQVSIPLLLSAAAVALEVNRRLKKHREEGDSEERMLALSAIP